MEIKVLGTGCAGCKALYETTKQAVEELALNATVVKEEDIMKIMSYNVMQLPALVVVEYEKRINSVAFSCIYGLRAIVVKQE